MEDQVLQEKFEKAFFKIRKQLGKSNEIEEINKAIELIIDEKTFFHMHEKAYEKIVRLESLLKGAGKPIPPELSYRKASIYIEFENEYEKAEKILLSIIDNEKTDEGLKDRCRFALCKSYLKQRTVYSEDNINNLAEENISKAKIQFRYLQERALSRKLDDYVRRDLWELKTTLDNINRNNKFIILTFPGGKEEGYLSREEALNHIDKINIFLDFISKDSFINGNAEALSDDEMNLIYLLSKGTTTEEAQEKLEIERDNFFQRVKRLRAKLGKFGIKTLNRKYKFEPSVTIKVLYKIDDENDFYYYIIASRNRNNF